MIDALWTPLELAATLWKTLTVGLEPPAVGLEPGLEPAHRGPGTRPPWEKGATTHTFPTVSGPWNLNR